MSDKFIDSFAFFLLNACVQPPSTEPNSPATVQNLSLTENLVAAANKVTCRHGDLCDDREQRTTSDIVVDFEFRSEDQARRGELLLCEILARDNPAVVNDVINDFESRVALILNPVATSLNGLNHQVSPEDPILKSKLRTVEQALKNTQDGLAAYVEDIKQQTESQAWERVATAWVEMNRFLEGMKGLRRETLGIEVAIIRTPGSEPMGRLPTHPIENAQIGPVVRTESVVRVSFDLFLSRWPAKCCRDIASTVNHSCPFLVFVTDMDIILRFDDALLKTSVTALNRLTPEGVSQHFEGGLGQQLAGCA